MYVIPSEKLVYFAQPRTASVAIARWLMENYEDCERVYSHPMWPPGWGDHHGVDLPTLEDLKEAGYKAVCAVRNHWDWCVSMYFWDTKRFPDDKKPTFGHWLENRLVGPEHLNLYTLQSDAVFYGQRWGIKPRKGYLFWLFPQISDTVMKYETQVQELSELLGREVELERVDGQISSRLPTSNYYTRELYLFVRDLWGKEIAEYQYDFQG